MSLGLSQKTNSKNGLRKKTQKLQLSGRQWKKQKQKMSNKIDNIEPKKEYIKAKETRGRMKENVGIRKELITAQQIAGHIKKAKEDESRRKEIDQRENARKKARNLTPLQRREYAIKKAKRRAKRRRVARRMLKRLKLTKNVKRTLTVFKSKKKKKKRLH
jgi:hypothetical protein